MDKNIVYFTSREEWRNWLTNNFETVEEVYFTFPTLESNEVGVSYNDAVEEALCFNWIDGIAYRLDDTHQIRRFTPRRKNSPYSRLNIERLIYLYSLDMIHPKYKKEVKKIISKPFVFPKDIIEAIKKDKKAWKNYQNFLISYKRIRISYIEAARNNKEEFNKRLTNFIDKTRENKIISGYGGSDKYYS